MTRCWLLLAVLACGGPNGPRTVATAPAEPVPAPTTARSKPHSAPRPTVDEVVSKPQLVSLPTVDVSAFRPDFHDELRWPLTSTQHPTFEPSFDVAAQLARGMNWRTLCQKGAQRRSGGNAELQQYLRGWCAALDSDIATSLRELMPLLRSRLANNVRLDIANILTNAGDAEEAEHWLQKFQLAREHRLVDLLAAGYVEARTTRDARRINSYAMENDDQVPTATKCLRWTREIVLSGNRESASLRFFDASHVAADVDCTKLKNKLRCWVDPKSCSRYYDDLNFGRDARDVVEAVDAWDDARTSSQWMGIAFTASRARNVEGAELAVAALENARLVAVSNCNGDLRAVISFVEHRLEKLLQTRADLTSRLRALVWSPSCGDASEAPVSQTVKSKTRAYTIRDISLLSRDLRDVDDEFWSVVARSAVVVADFDTSKIEEVCELRDEPQRWQSLLTDRSRADVKCAKATDGIVCIQGPGSGETSLMMMFATVPHFRLTAVSEGKDMTTASWATNQVYNAIRSAMTNSRCKSR